MAAPEFCGLDPSEEDEIIVGEVYQCGRGLKVRVAEDKTSDPHPETQIEQDVPFLLKAIGKINKHRGLVEWDAGGIRHSAWATVVFPPDSSSKQDLRIQLVDDLDICARLHGDYRAAERLNSPTPLAYSRLRSGLQRGFARRCFQ